MSTQAWMTWMGALLALSVALPITPPAVAEPQPVRGSQFVTMMQSNTLSGTSRSGAAYNLYFLPGGILSYEDSTGARDHGTWALDADDDVCVDWHGAADRQKGCFHVMVDGDRMTWRGKSGSGRAILRGGIADTLLTKKP